MPLELDDGMMWAAGGKKAMRHVCIAVQPCLPRDKVDDGTYRSMRHDRYDLERPRHSGSLVPRCDLMHRRYDSMMSLHSPEMQCQRVVCTNSDDGSVPGWFEWFNRT